MHLQVLLSYLPMSFPKEGACILFASACAALSLVGLPCVEVHSPSGAQPFHRL